MARKSPYSGGKPATLYGAATPCLPMMCDPPAGRAEWREAVDRLLEDHRRQIERLEDRILELESGHAN